VCGRGGTFGCRESIFKISHTKSELCADFPDARSDVARARLQMARVVYEGGRHRAGREGSRAASRQGSRVWRLRVAPAPPLPAGAQKPPPPRGLGWGGCPGTPGHLSRRGYRCAYHPIHTAPLLRSSLRSAGGSAASGASLPRSRQRLRPEAGEGGCRRGRGRRPRPRRLGFVGDWALPTTTAIASGGPRSAEAHAEAARSASSWGA
jgi:hypothetical protein